MCLVEESARVVEEEESACMIEEESACVVVKEEGACVVTEEEDGEDEEGDGRVHLCEPPRRRAAGSRRRAVCAHLVWTGQSLSRHIRVSAYLDLSSCTVRSRASR